MNISTLWNEVLTLLRADSALSTLAGVAANIAYPMDDVTKDYDSGRVAVLIHSPNEANVQFEAGVFWLGIGVFGKLPVNVRDAFARVRALLHGYPLVTSGALSCMFTSAEAISYDDQAGLHSGLLNFDIKGS